MSRKYAIFIIIIIILLLFIYWGISSINDIYKCVYNSKYTEIIIFCSLVYTFVIYYLKGLYLEFPYQPPQLTINYKDQLVMPPKSEKKSSDNFVDELDLLEFKAI